MFEEFFFQIILNVTKKRATLSIRTKKSFVLKKLQLKIPNLLNIPEKKIWKNSNK
uniref:Uncharacterized protein n=1 Tax=Rhizophagus irregularis (strain DAOM 181602 / DAOM 197198 / MUCL 43194) TaxID=747089 RepID=U9TXW7_RHIID